MDEHLLVLVVALVLDARIRKHQKKSHYVGTAKQSLCEPVLYYLSKLQLL